MPLFQDFEQLQRAELEIVQDFTTEWQEAWRKFDLASAVIGNDADVLAKFDKSEITLTKAQTQRHSSTALAKNYATIDLLTALKTSLLKRNSRMFGNNEVSKRSMRFAQAQARAYSGAPATVTELKKP